MATAAFAAALALLVAVPAAVAAAPNVWINEIHYDNAGVDVGEGVEVAGPAGTDLMGWRIELYNGFDGLSYATLPLSGAFADQRDGYGTRWLAVPGLQNGPRDGIALVDAAGEVVELLSYEGSLTPVGGAASGLASAAILPFEHPSTPVGRSLQLIGTGASSGDFTWSPARPASPGAVNDEQGFPTLAGGAVEAGPATSSGAPDSPAPPSMTILRLRRGISAGRARDLHLGRIRYVISGPAIVSFRIAPLVRIPQGTGSCGLPASRSDATRSCETPAPDVGEITDVGAEGRNTVAFGGRIDGRPLAPGRYLLTARIGTGDERQVSFRVTR